MDARRWMKGRSGCEEVDDRKVDEERGTDRRGVKSGAQACILQRPLISGPLEFLYN